MKRLMILWSGGIDSTAILKMYLERTDYVVCAVNLNLQIRGALHRVNKEQESIEILYDKLKEIRDFKLLRPKVEFEHPINMSDVMFIANLANPIAAIGNMTEIILGFVKYDNPKTLAYHDSVLKTLNNISRELYEFHGPVKNWKFAPSYVLPEFYNYKEEYIKELGDLYQYTWSCRVPRNGNPCGHCATCIEINQATTQN